MHSLTLIVKTLKQCNSQCTHCSVDKTEKQQLSEDNLVTIIDKIIKTPPINHKKVSHITLLWHGGEPMLRGVDFYKKAFEKLKVTFPDISFTEQMQSNMLCYDEEWGEWIKSHNVMISTSYDFFSSFRTLDKKTSEGEKKYFEIWQKNIKKYQSDTQKNIGCIVVLNTDNYQRIEEMFKIAEEMNIKLKLNCLYAVGEAKHISEKCLTIEQYTEAMLTALKYWYPRRHKVRFDQGEDFLSFAQSNKNRTMNSPTRNECVGIIYGIEPNGEVYNCSRCADIDLNSFGNFLSGKVNLSNIITMKRAEATTLKECVDCGICKSGCKYEKAYAGLTFTDKTPFCHTWKEMYRTIQELRKKDMDI